MHRRRSALPQVSDLVATLTRKLDALRLLTTLSSGVASGAQSLGANAVLDNIDAEIRVLKDALPELAMLAHKESGPRDPHPIFVHTPGNV